MERIYFLKCAYFAVNWDENIQKDKYLIKNMANSKFFFPLLCCALLQGCSSADKSAERNPVSVSVMIVESTAVSRSRSYSGTIEEENGSALSFAVAGTVKAVHALEGQRVSKGQLIASLDDSSLRNVHAAAEAALHQAQDAYSRMKMLYDSGSLPEIKWVEVQSTLSQAESAEKVARKNVDDAQLRAPYGGVLSGRSLEVGHNVFPGQTVVKIVDASQLEAKISVPETEIASVCLGQRALVKVQALGGRQFSGAVTEKGVVANPLSRSYDVKIRVDDAVEELLPGMVADITFMTDGVDQVKVVVPASVVQLGDDNSNFGWVVSDGKAERRRVVIGDYAAEGVIVSSGLREGDAVIVKGQQKVCNGTSVEIK